MITLGEVSKSHESGCVPACARRWVNHPSDLSRSVDGRRHCWLGQPRLECDGASMGQARRARAQGCPGRSSTATVMGTRCIRAAPAASRASSCWPEPRPRDRHAHVEGQHHRGETAPYDRQAVSTVPASRRGREATAIADDAACAPAIAAWHQPWKRRPAAGSQGFLPQQLHTGSSSSRPGAAPGHPERGRGARGGAPNRVAVNAGASPRTNSSAGIEAVGSSRRR